MGTARQYCTGTQAGVANELCTFQRTVLFLVHEEMGQLLA